VGSFRLIALAGVVVVALGAGACSSDSDPGVSSGTGNAPGTSTTVPVGGSMMTTIPASQLVTADTLAGQTFVSTSVTGHELVPDSSITLTFTATELRAVAGCNSMGGAYSLEGGTLVVAETASTMMGCDPALMDQDQWLAGFLAAMPTIAATGDGIVLASGDVTIELASGDAAASPTLVGPTWTLDTIQSGETASSVPAGVEPPTLVFADDGSVEVFTGCNGGSTTVEVGEDGFLTFEPMMTTMMSCGPEADGVAATVTTVLDGRVAYGWTDAGGLSLADGTQTLIYTPS